MAGYDLNQAFDAFNDFDAPVEEELERYYDYDDYGDCEPISGEQEPEASGLFDDYCYFDEEEDWDPYFDGYESFLEDIRDEQFLVQDNLLDPRNNPRLQTPRRPRKDRRGTFNPVKVINPVLARKEQEQIESQEEIEFLGWDGRYHTFLVRGNKIKASAESALGRKPVRKHRDRRPEMRNELQKLFRETELNRIDAIELAQMNLDENGEFDADLEAEREYNERFPLPPPKPKPREVWLYL